MDCSKNHIDAWENSKNGGAQNNQEDLNYAMLASLIWRYLKDSLCQLPCFTLEDTVGIVIIARFKFAQLILDSAFIVKLMNYSELNLFLLVILSFLFV